MNTVRKKKRKPSARQRRAFIRSLFLGAGLVGASLAGFVPVLTRWKERVRPPGALEEQKYLSACIKCGQCVQVCPVEAIKLGDLDEGYGVGAAYIDTREQACDFSCDGLQCVLACPTGALTHDINYPHEARMGVAVVVNHHDCLAHQGKGFKGQVRGPHFEGKLRYEEIDRWNPIPVRDHPYDLEQCDLCVRHCPIEQRANQCDAGTPPSGDPNQCPPKRAIRLTEMRGRGGRMTVKPEILEGCVGCGVCEMICPAEPSVFVMDIAESRGWTA